MVELRVRVDEKKIKRFREYVKERHEKLYATLGLELGNAMDEYIDRRNYEDAHAHTHIGRKQDKHNSKPDGNSAQVAYANGGERTKRRIVQHLEESGVMEAVSLSENAVRKVIAQIAGYDKRTVDKYFCLLDEESLLPKNIEFE